MKSEPEFKLLDEAVCISLHANPLGKGEYQFVPPSYL